MIAELNNDIVAVDALCPTLGLAPLIWLKT
jgi:hypothetical protein